MTRMIRQLHLAMAVALGSSALSVLLVSAGTSPADAATSLPSTAVGTRISSVSPCQQVVFIGSEGSGQTGNQASGLGPEVYEAWLSYKSHLPNAAIGYFPNPYPAAPADILSLVGSDAYQKTFAASVDSGVREISSFLDSRRGCPDEHYVLAGYSQGAMVSHRALEEIRAGRAAPQSGNLFNRVDGTILIADGDRTGESQDIQYGTAPRTSSSAGISWDSVVSSQVSYTYPVSTISGPRVHDICVSGDAVCDFSSLNLTQGGDIHGNSYSRWAPNKKYAGTGVAYVRSAATNVSKVTAQWRRLSVPTRITTETVPDALVGARFSAPLSTADNRPGVWTITTGSLPAGLRLQGAKIVGKPVGPGRSAFTVQFDDGVNRITRQLTVRVAGRAPAQISTASLPSAAVGQSYSARLLTSDNRPGVWSVTGGQLPGGLSLTGDTISGTPTVPGDFPLTVTFDDGSVPVSRSLVVVVDAVQYCLPNGVPLPPDVTPAPGTLTCGANDDALSIYTPVTVNLLSNDFKVEYPVRFAASRQPDGSFYAGDDLVVPGVGRYSLDGSTGYLTFAPAEGFLGRCPPVRYEYGDTESASVSFTVTPPPAGPPSGWSGPS